MKRYLDILRRILNEGKPKQPVRVGQGGSVVTVENSTIGLTNVFWEHNMEDGFPLLTTKKMAVKSMLVELEFFLKGLTDKQWLKERGCYIWNEWCNPEAEVQDGVKVKDWPNSEFIGRNWEPGGYESHDEFVRRHRKIAQERENDLGPLGYSWNWRKFGQQYGDISFEVDNTELLMDSDWYDVVHATTFSNVNGLEKGFDQLKVIADRLRKNPYDRRMVCSAWNPNQVHMMALPPCHISWIVSVYGDELNLHFTMRSSDAALGIPFNISSYAVLLYLLARHANLKPGKLSAVFMDCHLYENQLDGVREQLKREPYPLPSVEIPSNSDEDGYDFNIFNWDHTQFELSGYQHHPALKMPVTV